LKAKVISPAPTIIPMKNPSSLRMKSISPAGAKMAKRPGKAAE
jgi:hypothetical protein